jgi:uncharacterized protein (TIGR02118 family)
MANNKIINIVATMCQPQDAVKFNKWYNEIHVPMLLKFKNLAGVERYKAIGADGEAPRYIAVYKFTSLKDFQAFSKSPELAAAVKEMNETWGQKIELTSRVQYELIKEW